MMGMPAEELRGRLEFAVAAAKDAAEVILGYYQKVDLVVDLKRDRSPVTAADREAEQLLRDRIAAAYPDDGVLGEELEDKPSGNGCRWILDPIDGTKSFIHGVPLFGTLIGLESDGDLVLGVCHFPALQEVVYAARGQGTWWQQGTDEPRKAAVSSIRHLADALFCTTTITGWEQIGHRETFDRLCGASGLTRGWGDCYGHILVATGRADVMIDPAMNPWDAAALVPIVQEAGGRFVDWTGQTTIHSGNGLSVNPALESEVLAMLAPNQG